MKTSRILLMLTSLVLVSACGTKGDLVLPGKETPRRTVAPITLPGAADSARDSDATSTGAGETIDAAGESSDPAGDAADTPPAEPPTDE